MAASALTYWHTLRHLKPVQIYGRVLFRLNKPRPDRSRPPGLRKQVGGWLAPPERQTSMVGPFEFKFLGETHKPQRWNDKPLSKLWLYNLHYFDDLNAASGRQRDKWHRDLIDKWIAENRPGRGIGWEPYPTSLRIVNWIKWLMPKGEKVERKWLHSLAIQTRYLAKRIEWHLLGNHLIANAKALIFAGCYFKGREAAGWLRTGTRILRKQLDEQILTDGGHFERSPMYHSIILEDMLDIINLSGAYGPVPALRLIKELDKRAPAMLDWLSAMCHGDGRISFFNDAAFDIAIEPAALADYAAKLGISGRGRESGGLAMLKPSGYARLERRSALILADVAPIGPDYLPGHAHADTLSFEFSHGPERIIINSGTSEYGTGPERLRQRGTAAHSTVEINGENSSEVWGGFRVARRARVSGIQAGEDADFVWLRAAHNGYRRLKEPASHRREWRLANGSLVITDQINGQFDQAIARFHLHDQVRAWISYDDVRMMTASGRKLMLRTEGGKPRLVKSTWHPRFGESVATNCIEVPLEDRRLICTMVW